MILAATRPVLWLATKLISLCSRAVPLPREAAFYFAALTLGPCLGSFITEPAAMTVTALLLKRRYFDRGMPSRFLYVTLATLFVNVSIGGVFTNFSAPPVLMVAGQWNWNTPFMFLHFGWKAAVAVVINAGLAVTLFRGVLGKLAPAKRTNEKPSPLWLVVIHLFFLTAIIVTSHHLVIFLGLFLFFVGVATATREYQDELKLKESLLVGFFLGGVVILGGVQAWWLAPVLRALPPLPLFLGASGLTAVLDNAALTYLGAQVPGLEFSLKYALVAGAVTGGGLTVIANAPNPSGYAILGPSFGPDGISPWRLLRAALAPTLVAMACFWFLPA
jgi:uncharacterized membrane protein